MPRIISTYNPYTIELQGIKNKKPEECETNLERWIYNLFNMGTTTKPLEFQALPIEKKNLKA